MIFPRAKSPDRFYNGSSCHRGHDGLRYASDGKCVECIRARNAKYHRENRDKDKERARRAKPEYRERRRVYLTAYRHANREKAKAQAAKWQKLNPAAVVAGAARHYARKRNARGRGVSAAQWRSILAGAMGICAYCNERRVLQMEHIEPLARVGDHDVDNVAAACGSCNTSKGDRPLLVWLALRARSRYARLAA